MTYQIARNGQMYGPYTMEDLHRYLASGHVLPTDLAKSEEMAEWIPVSQLLGTAAQTVPASAYGSAALSPQPTYAGTGAPYPDPPNLHWAVVLLLDLLTCSLFQMVWNIVLAAWFRRVSPGSKALLLYIASAVLLLLQAGTAQTAGLMSGRHGFVNPYGVTVHSGGYGVYGLVVLVSWVVRLIARFTFRSELEQHFNTVDPLGLRLNPVLTFFFGGIYFQSQMNRINDIKRGLAYR